MAEVKLTSCSCKDRTHRHRDEPCENIGSEPNGLCSACDALTKKPPRIAALESTPGGPPSTRTKEAG